MSRKHSLLLTLTLWTAAAAIGQMPAAAGQPAEWFALGSIAAPQAGLPQPGDAAQLLHNFKDSDIRFDLTALTDLLRDHQHEGWVLAAYPDPNTRRPLIGAGFSLDVPARSHLQTDPLNGQAFVEPSSAQLWQAAGLAPERLQQILDEYDRNVNAWTPRSYRHRVIRQTLPAQLTEAEGEQLLRISAIQAVYNARAYCREFDQLSASQQMALTQLVFQMGVNLEQFVTFLGVINDGSGIRELPRLDGYIETGPQHWKTVQNTLMDSQWARRYSVRAASVIAMFDPNYSRQPAMAEQRVLAVLHPPVALQKKTRAGATLRLASYSKRSGKSRGRKAARPQTRRKLT